MPNLGDIHTHYSTFSSEAGIVHNYYDITEHKVVKSGACEEGEQMQIANTAVGWETYLRLLNKVILMSRFRSLPGISMRNKPTKRGEKNLLMT